MDETRCTDCGHLIVLCECPHDCTAEERAKT
jgi:hypothetical protein